MYYPQKNYYQPTSTHCLNSHHHPLGTQSKSKTNTKTQLWLSLHVVANSRSDRTFPAVLSLVGGLVLFGAV